MSGKAPPLTPDGRYIVVRARLWRAANPNLPEPEKTRLIAELMDGRRAVRSARGNPAAIIEARARVDAAKHGLGERGPAWWDDGAPDWNRHLARNTPYADWFAALEE